MMMMKRCWPLPPLAAAAASVKELISSFEGRAEGESKANANQASNLIGSAWKGKPRDLGKLSSTNLAEKSLRLEQIKRLPFGREFDAAQVLKKMLAKNEVIPGASVVRSFEFRSATSIIERCYPSSSQESSRE